MAWSIHDFTNKNSNIFSLKMKKQDEETIDIGRDFQHPNCNRKVLGSTPHRSTRISFFRVCLCHFE